MNPAPSPAEPTSDKLSDGAQRLLAEGDAALSGSSFARANISVYDACY